MKYLPEFEYFLLYSWKIETLISKIKRSKVSDYAALNFCVLIFIF